MTESLKQIRERAEDAKKQAGFAEDTRRSVETDYHNAVSKWAKGLAAEMDQRMVDALGEALDDAGKKRTQMHKV